MADHLDQFSDSEDDDDSEPESQPEREFVMEHLQAEKPILDDPMVLQALTDEYSVTEKQVKRRFYPEEPNPQEEEKKPDDLDSYRILFCRRCRFRRWRRWRRVHSPAAVAPSTGA